MLTVELKSRHKMPLYEQLYLKIRGLITDGELTEGDKLPSERGLAANLQISRSTVGLAYGQLYAEGYVEVRPQSGYYVNKIDRINSEKKEEFTDIKNESVNPEPEYEYDFSPFHCARRASLTGCGTDSIDSVCVTRERNSLTLVRDRGTWS